MVPIWLLRWWDCLAPLLLGPDADLGDMSRRAASVRYHLGRGRRASEHACALCPSNGYFIRLLLEVLDAQGDGTGRDDALARAWWSGAPVERWP